MPQGKALNEIDSYSSELAEEKRELTRLRAKVLHQYGVFLQNSGQHNLADEQLKVANDLRDETDRSQAPYTRFQRFMNGYQAGAGHPVFAREMDEARALRDYLSEVASECANPNESIVARAGHLHNLGFVHQAEGELQQAQRNWPTASEHYHEAIKNYQDAKNVRVRLRDPRMIAQSEVLLGECKIALAEILIEQRAEHAQIVENIDRAREHAAEARRIYAEVPQEALRHRDLYELQRRIAEASRKQRDARPSLER